MPSFPLGGYLLQITKERKFVITQRKRIFANAKAKVVELVILVFGRFSIDFKKVYCISLKYLLKIYPKPPKN